MCPYQHGLSDGWVGDDSDVTWVSGGGDVNSNVIVIAMSKVMLYEWVGGEWVTGEWVSDRLCYNIALCYYKLKQYSASLKYITISRAWIKESWWRMCNIRSLIPDLWAFISHIALRTQCCVSSRLKVLMYAVLGTLHCVTMKKVTAETVFSELTLIITSLRWVISRWMRKCHFVSILVNEEDFNECSNWWVSKNSAWVYSSLTFVVMNLELSVGSVRSCWYSNTLSSVGKSVSHSWYFLLAFQIELLLWEQCLRWSSYREKEEVL